MNALGALPACVLFAALLPIFPEQARGDDVWLSPYSQTRHYRYDGYRDAAGVYKKYQDSHPSAGFEFVGAGGDSLSVGAYNDSRGRIAAYVARRWDYGYGAGIAAGVLLGPGYRHGFSPFVGPELALVLGPTRWSIGAIPGFGIEGKSNLVVAKIAIRWGAP